MFLRSLRSPRLTPLFYASTYINARFASRTVTHTFKLADIGEGITECEVIRWSVAPRASITAFDPLCEVQSDKASVEITSPWDGVVKELLVQEGQVAKVGQGLCLIEVEEEGETGVDEGSRSVEASGKEEPPISLQAEEEVPKEPVPSPATESAPTRRPHPLDPSFPPPTGGGADNVLAAPSTRHFARAQGVDLAQLAPGSGKGGRIEKSDVEAFLAGSSSSSTPTYTKSGEDVVVELSRTRHAMWRAMVKSLEIPQFGYSATLDITELHALLPLLNAHIPAHYLPPSTSHDANNAPFDPAHALGPGVGLPQRPEVPETGRYTRVTYLPFLLKTLARAMMDWPLFRASITPSSSSSPPSSSNPKPTLTIRPHADIALALATPSGLYTPLLRAADSSSIYALSSQIAHLAALGRRTPSGLTREHLSGGGTISVSNVGAAGHGTGAAPVLIHGGGVAIVALGRAEWELDVSERYWQKNRYDSESSAGAVGRFVSAKGEEGEDYGRGQRRLKLPISWAADHRVVEGAEMAAFVEAWRGWVERPGRMIGEGV